RRFRSSGFLDREDARRQGGLGPQDRGVLQYEERAGGRRRMRNRKSQKRGPVSRRNTKRGRSDFHKRDGLRTGIAGERGGAGSGHPKADSGIAQTDVSNTLRSDAGSRPVADLARQSLLSRWTGEHDPVAVRRSHLPFARP